MVVTRSYKLINILIIGTGNIGLRHLESLLKSKNKLNIYLYDVVYSDKISSLILNIKKKKNINIKKLQSLDIKKKIDISIISTNSRERFKLAYEVIKNIKIKYIILEKIVFQSSSHFEKIIKFSNKKKIKIFVNCPRRTYKIFKFIKNKLNKTRGIIKLSLVGNNWGLCSNSIHFLDLLFYFTNFEEDYIMDQSLNNKILRSKRRGYYELKGKVSVYNKNFKFFIQDSNEKKNIRLKISRGDEKYVIENDKANKNFILKNKGSNMKLFKIPLQSELTLKLVNNIINKNKYELTELKDSYNYHKILFNIFNNKLSKLLNKKLKNCPIT